MNKKPLITDALKFEGVCPIATARRYDYSRSVHQKADELVLAGYKPSTGAPSARAFFVRNISMRSHVMAKLERDIFICAGHLLSLSANPFQLCHPYLAVNGKAPLNQQERINHA